MILPPNTPIHHATPISWKRDFCALEVNEKTKDLFVTVLALNIFQRILRSLFGAYNSTIWTQAKIDHLLTTYPENKYPAEIKKIRELVEKVNGFKSMKLTVPEAERAAAKENTSKETTSQGASRNTAVDQTKPGEKTPAVSARMQGGQSEGLIGAIKTGDFSKINEEDFSGLQEAIAYGKETQDKQMLVNCLKAACLVFGLVKIDLKDILNEVKDVLTEKDFGECDLLLSRCGKLPSPRTGRTNLAKTFDYQIPPNFSEMSVDEQEKAISIQLAKKLNVSSNLFQGMNDGLLGKIYDAKIKVDAFDLQVNQMLLESKKNELIQNLQREKQIKQQQEQSELKKKHAESLAGFLQIFNGTNSEDATRFINGFDIKTKFSNLWYVADNSPSADIPYEDLTAEKVQENYKITFTEFENFIRRIDKSLETIRSLSGQAESSLKSSCENIAERLVEIRGNVAALLERKRRSGGADMSLDAGTFSALKLDNQLRAKLKGALEEIERKSLLDFYAHLAFVTLNGGNNSQLVTVGLEKLRDYITTRSPRQKIVMDRGDLGVAGFIHESCLKSLFSTNNLSEITPHLANMRKGNLVKAADPINLGGIHFICKVLTDRGFYELDSMGTRKTPQESIPLSFDLKYPTASTVCVGEDFYASCSPLSIDQISVPRQKENNCYLAAGWLTFSTFLYFYNQSIKTV